MLVAEYTRLTQSIANLKKTMRDTREALQAQATARAALEAECRRRGIGLVLKTKGVGDIHGRQQTEPAHAGS